MALTITQRNNLKAFFVALDHFKYDLGKIPPSMIVKGLPIKKEECLNLLRDLPGLKEKTNIELGELLKNQADRNRILGELLTGERVEIEKAIAENQKPTTREEIIGQPSAEGTPVEQVPPPAGTSDGTPMGGMPGIPSAPSISLPRVIRDFKTPHTPPPTAIEGGTGKGLAATSKIDRLEARRVGPATIQTKATSEVSRQSAPVSSRFNFNSLKGFKIPSSLKTLGSNTQIFASKNLVRVGNGLWNMGKIGTGGAYNLGVGTANRFLDAYAGISRSGPIVGSRSIVGKLGRFGRGGGGGTSPVGKAGANWGKRAIILLLLGMLLTGVLVVITGTDQTGIIPPIGSSDISNCKFTRAGNSQLIKSSILASWISNGANTVGVPASILASIAMHESPDFVANAENNHDAIKSNRYCSNGSPVCLRGGEKEHDGDCTENEIQAGLKTATAKGLMQLIDVYNPDMNEEDFCNIQKNILRGADTLKRKAGSGSLNNENDIKRAVCGYFGPGGTTCPYPGGDYGAEAWTDYQNCQTQSPAIGSRSNFVFYCQGNTASQQCSLGQSGCGPTSVAMVLSTFGIIQTPTQVDQVFQSNGWRSCGVSPSSLIAAIHSSWFNGLGFQTGPNLVTGSSFNITEAKRFLDQGYLIIGSSEEYPCVKCASTGIISHIFVVDNVDINSSNVNIRDPNNCSYTDGDDEYQTNRIKSVTAFPWFYAYPVKLVR